MAGGDVDSMVRLRAFRFLEEQAQLHTDTLPWRVLLAGFEYEGRRVPLVSPQGIFTPAVLRLPLSITTAPAVEGKQRPYDDEMSPDGLLSYRYRGSDPSHRDNVGLRQTMRERIPLVYLHGVAEGYYAALWPVFVVADDPGALTFTVALGRETAAVSGPVSLEDLTFENEGERRYATRAAIVRLHQRGFRMRVLQAYRECCAICRLRHRELLDAAHILPDSHPRGQAVVPNGLALCSLHHAAFDRNVLGVNPNLKVEVRLDILREVDGPMLEHGLQGFHGKLIAVPRQATQRPNPEFLAERYEAFRKAS